MSLVSLVSLVSHVLVPGHGRCCGTSNKRSNLYNFFAEKPLKGEAGEGRAVPGILPMSGEAVPPMEFQRTAKARRVPVMDGTPCASRKPYR